MAALRSGTSAVVAALACVLGCGGGTRPPAAQHRAGGGDDITLYRDRAVIRQRVSFVLPATPTTVTVSLAAGVAADQITLLDRGGLAIVGVHGKTTPDRGDENDAADDDTLRVGDEFREYRRDAAPAELDAVRPTELRIDLDAPRAGTYSIVIGYATDRLRWDAAYTMITAGARDRGELSGGLAIRNDTGIVLRAGSARVIDAELGPWRGKTAERLAATLVGGTQSTTPPATPRELGAMELGEGETRVEIVRDTARRIRSVLVYDPIGTKLDNPGATPLRDVELGVDTPASTHVSESFEIARDTRGTAGLPGGPVRLFDRRPTGALGMIGEARLFDASTRVSDVDTIAVGTAVDVTGTRERREVTVDDDNKRLVEEFVITLHNNRAHPVEVLVREHLYRGQNWTLAYHSAPEASKEGPQQISLRTKVPAKSKARILYVVVYTWGQ